MKLHSRIALASATTTYAEFHLQSSLCPLHTSSQVTRGGCQSSHAAAVGRLTLNDGAGDAVAFLGIFRLVHYLAQKHLLGSQRVKFVVDAGTETTSIGLQLVALCLGLPWEFTTVMLADTIDGYKRQEARMISVFKRQFGFHYMNHDLTSAADGGMMNWVEHFHPRKSGHSYVFME